MTNVDINTNSVYIGVLAGSNIGTIENVIVDGGSIVANTTVGGLVGSNEGTISDSVASVNVHGVNGTAGGLVGYNREGSISRSSASGNVTGQNNVGGMVGEATGILEEIIATGNVSGVSSVGGLIGIFGNNYPLDPISILTDSHAEGEVSGHESILGGLIGSTRNRTNILRSYATGNVTASLKDVNDVTSRMTDVGGLIGQSSGDISDSYATGHVTGKSNVGGLVGNNYSSTISNSYSTNAYAMGTVEAMTESSSKIGGLIGGSSSIVENSYATGTVTSNGSEVGDLIGNQYQRKVANSYALGNVIGNSDVGGLIGFGTNFPLEHSFATGDVQGENNVGGLAGYFNDSPNLRNVFATGQVTGVEFVGGLVGHDPVYVYRASYYLNVMAFGDVN